MPEARKVDPHEANELFGFVDAMVRSEWPSDEIAITLLALGYGPQAAVRREALLDAAKVLNETDTLLDPAHLRGTVAEWLRKRADEFECDHNPGIPCQHFIDNGNGHCCREYLGERK